MHRPPRSIPHHVARPITQAVCHTKPLRPSVILLYNKENGQSAGQSQRITQGNLPNTKSKESILP